MKKIIASILLGVIFQISFIEQNIFAQVNKFVNLSTIITNPASKTGWNLIFQDEFNNSKRGIWDNSFCGDNSTGPSSHYTKNENFLYTSTYLQLRTKKENPPFIPTSPGWDYVSKYYSSAVLNSDTCIYTYTDSLPITNHSYRYGYFEAKIRNPKGQFMWPSFWLFGEPNPKLTYNEIDCFEFGSGDALVMSNHWQAPSALSRTSIGKWIYSLPSQTFGNT